MTGQRQTSRLQGSDYSRRGCNYVTICTRDRACLFGEVRNGEMRLNGQGQIARDEWSRSADIRAELALDSFVVMPNHVHGIVFIDGEEGDPPVALSRQTQDGVATQLPRPHCQARCGIGQDPSIHPRQPAGMGNR